MPASQTTASGCATDVHPEHATRLAPSCAPMRDTLTANYESAITRAGLQQNFEVKVMQYRQFHGIIGDLPNEVTFECIRNVLHDGTQPSANALAATPAPAGKEKPHDATRNGRQQPKAKPRGGRDRELPTNKRRVFDVKIDRPCRHCAGGHWDPDCPKKPKR